jgi:uncharacterized membrane protein
MRKTLEVIALGALAFLSWITYRALYGPDPLPDRIPTHFNLAGQPDAWGSPSSLPLLPAVAAGLYLLITLAGLLPVSFKAPIRMTEENRARLEALSRQMLAWFKMCLVCLFAWIQWSILDSVRRGNARLSPMIILFFLVAVFGGVGWHIAAMIRASRPGSSS